MNINDVLENRFRSITLDPLRWLAAQIKVRRQARRLRLVETLPLGANRFVALIRVEDQEFLVGGAGSSLSLLARLTPNVEAEGSSQAAENRESIRQDES